MGDQTTSVDGYVIDIACIRKHSRAELQETARTHSKECALMGHCVESGYGIVTVDDRLTVLDPEATQKVTDVVAQSETREGIRLHVTREKRDGEMQTTTVDEL